MSKGRYKLKGHYIAHGDGMIVNCISIIDQNSLLTSCNDSTVKIYDINTMNAATNIKFKDPINIATLSPDGYYLGVYGDCI